MLILRLWERDPNHRPSFATCSELLTNFQSGNKRPDGFLKNLLNRERARAITALVAPDRENVPQVHVVSSNAPFSWSESVMCCVVRPSVDGLRESLWMGGNQGGLLVAETSGKVLFEVKKAHSGGLSALVCSGLNGKVWSGGAEGTVQKWDLDLKKVEVVERENSASPNLTGQRVSLSVSKSGGNKVAARPSLTSLNKSTSLAKTPTAVRAAPVPPRPSTASITNPPSAQVAPHKSPRTAASPRPEGGPKLTMGRRGAPPASAVASAAAAPASTPGSAENSGRGSASTELPRVGSGHDLVAAEAGGDLSEESPAMTFIRVPELKNSAMNDQPHKGFEIKAMMSVATSGSMVIGDSKGTITVWNKDGVLVFKTRLEHGIHSFCSAGEFQIWVAEGQNLHRVEVSKTGTLSLGRTFQASSPQGFSGMMICGTTLWVSDGPSVKLIDTLTSNVIKVR